MADHCSLCNTRRPAGGTNHLVLNSGKLWIEFCPPCGETVTLLNPMTKETATVRELFDRSQKEEQTHEKRTQ